MRGWVRWQEEDKSDERDWGVGVVREAAECRMETFTSQRDRAEKSQLNGGNTEDGLSDRKKEKLKKKRWTIIYSSNSSLSKTTLFNKPTWQYLCTWFHFIIHWQSELGEQYLRHRNDHEIQPVPWISKECKPVYTESSRCDFYKRLKCINSREGVPERKMCWQNQFRRLDQSSLISTFLHPC